MLTVTQEDRHEVANRLQNGPMASLDAAAPLLTLRGYCPLCSAEVNELRDEASLREFRISGLCQSCQDSVFGADGEAMEVATDPADFVELQEPHWNELD